MAFTFFFRDRHTLEQLADQLIAFKKQGEQIKIWDAGCAMGPEPYTFAMILREKIGNEWFQNVQILASDIDELGNFQSIINNGIYKKHELERMPEDIFNKYFTQYDADEQFILGDEIKNSLKFIKHDLLTLKPLDLNFDAIICKNVLLHFEYKQRIDVLNMFHKVLNTNGLLTTEQTQSIPEEITDKFERLVSNANVFKKR
ncbi:MAG TPA: CheR family methyltransferase [Candidatus Kapabacteria bacterium]|nr:CheR family methyltransferase [Candidatus Kapabacteria bacterium]